MTIHDFVDDDDDDDDDDENCSVDDGDDCIFSDNLDGDIYVSRNACRISFILACILILTSLSLSLSLSTLKLRSYI